MQLIKISENILLSNECVLTRFTIKTYSKTPLINKQPNAILKFYPIDIGLTIGTKVVAIWCQILRAKA